MKSSQRTTRTSRSLRCASRWRSLCPARKHRCPAELEGAVLRRPVDCGLFRVDVSSARALVAKHEDILERVLSIHASTACSTARVDRRFEAVRLRLSARPRTLKRRASWCSDIPGPDDDGAACGGYRRGRRLLRRPRHSATCRRRASTSRRGGRPSAGRSASRHPQRRRGGAPRCGALPRGDDLDQTRFDASLGAIEAEVKAFADMADLAEVEKTAQLCARRLFRPRQRLALQLREALFEDTPSIRCWPRPSAPSSPTPSSEDCAGPDAARAGWLTGLSSTLTPRWSSSR